jgi:EAL domain-containing protein (putative c-di-GMP-specific phosphodiesterase class I)
MGTLGQIRLAGGETDALLGTPPRELAGADIGAFLNPVDRRSFFDELRAIDGTRARRLRCELVGARGTVPVELTIEPESVITRRGEQWVVRCEALDDAGTTDDLLLSSLADPGPVGAEPAGSGARDDLDLSPSAIERALLSGEFDLDFQPIVDLATGQPVGYEALVRWVRQDLRRVPAAVFLSAVEDAGLMPNLSRHVLERGLERLAGWAGDAPERGITVNVAPSDLARRGFALDVGRIVADANVDPQRLVLEFTEEALRLDPDGLAGTLTRLRDIAGVQLALDDFGTVRSSLAALTLPVDVLKLDRSVTTQALASSRSRAVLSRLMDMSAATGTHVIGEGVEDRSQLQMLEEVGCHYAQGYLLGRPGPATSGRIDQPSASGSSARPLTPTLA